MAYGNSCFPAWKELTFHGYSRSTQRKVSISRRARGSVGAGFASYVFWLARFLCPVDWKRGLWRPSASVVRSCFCSNPRRRALAVPLFQRMGNGRRRNLSPTVCPVRAGSLFRISAANSRRGLLHILFLRAISSDRNIHGGRAEPGTPFANSGRFRRRDSRLVLSVLAHGIAGTRHADRWFLPPSRLDRNVGNRRMVYISLMAENVNSSMNDRWHDLRITSHRSRVTAPEVRNVRSARKFL